MPGTLIPTRSAACPLCGLRYSSRPMLELHVREDHPHAVRAAIPHQAGRSHRVPGPRRPAARTRLTARAGPMASARPPAARARLMDGGDLLVIAPWLIFGAAVTILCLRLRAPRARARKARSWDKRP